jgi:hypothetical protein
VDSIVKYYPSITMQPSRIREVMGDDETQDCLSKIDQKTYKHHIERLVNIRTCVNALYRYAWMFRNTIHDLPLRRSLPNA